MKLFYKVFCLQLKTMSRLMMEFLFDFGAIVIADIVLSGDNALIIGMAAASLAPELRRKAIIYGMVVAAVLRVVFAVIATKLLGVPGLLLVGRVAVGLGVLAFVSRIFSEHTDEGAVEAMEMAERSKRGLHRQTQTNPETGIGFHYDSRCFHVSGQRARGSGDR